MILLICAFGRSSVAPAGTCSSYNSPPGGLFRKAPPLGDLPGEHGSQRLKMSFGLKLDLALEWLNAGMLERKKATADGAG